jgi:hypothetical protein
VLQRHVASQVEDAALRDERSKAANLTAALLCLLLLLLLVAPITRAGADLQDLLGAAPLGWVQQRHHALHCRARVGNLREAHHGLCGRHGALTHRRWLHGPSSFAASHPVSLSPALRPWLQTRCT